MVLQGHPSDGSFVWGDQCDYLRCLCQFKSARVSRDQMMLMIYSGFDFIKIARDYPHIAAEHPPVPRLFVFAMKVFVWISIVCGWLSIFVNLLFMSSLIWITVYWFSYPSKVNNGWWTIICYVVGYVIEIVVTMVAEGLTGRHYEDQLWHYPSSNLKIIPIFPVFESYLMALALRYAVMKERQRYFIIRRDLWCSVAVQQIFHTLFFAFPQVTLQLYLYTTRKSKGTAIDDTTVCIWLLLGAGGASCFMSIFANSRLVLFPHSCNAFGFAIRNVNPEARKRNHFLSDLRPSEVCIRLIYIHLLTYLITLIIVLFIHLLNITRGCERNEQVMLAVYFGIILVCVILYFVFLNYLPQKGVCAMCYLSFVPIIMQVAYYIFAWHEPANECSFIMYRFAGWTVPNMVAFGILCVYLCFWIALSIKECFVPRAKENLIDHLTCYFIQQQSL
ncbi:hypothetical protein STCU_05615 [Strigomonas culicis]|nr:hypothetical protein STCU_05615 [Strigomonas culicis]|eukprot:EPY27709.1 hypothetical protein STCU_05615 [Strigomonas culicis]